VAARLRVAVVVVTYNSADVIAACLNALPDALAGLDTVAVLVADNASVDGTAELVAEHGAAVGARFVDMGGNLGYAAAINRARQLAAAHDLLLVLNPDTLPEPGSVMLLAVALAKPGRGIAVPRLVGAGGVLAFNLRREPSLSTALSEAVLGGVRAAKLGWGEVVNEPDRYLAEGPADWATGAAVLITADCAAAVGDWNESFFLYSEETDFMLRARDAGFGTWLVPNAVVYHRGGESASAAHLWALVIQNKSRLYARRHGGASSTLYRGLLLLGEGVRAALGKQRSRAAVRALLGRPAR
jgi:N-acetylglucosaminyl-diphospho-decaprenol L-rhamnosyltransferase